ncbi:MAG TPA: NADH-quinone oxidoreductase subunit L [Chloroflexota bacterium]|nr:NADH-quinone oxidoreductase subunit L [Chloroflexota bacterium]
MTLNFTDVLPWAFLFTLPGLLLGSTGIIRKAGVGSIPGVLALLGCAVAWLLGYGQPATVELGGWLPFVPDGRFFLRVDGLTAFMLAILGLISVCVYVYSLGYLADDPGIRRFFAFLDVFVGAMALLVTAGNLAVLLIGWTGVGMTSYFLISFWRNRPRTLNAGLQAIAANAVGDGALILAAVLVPTGCGDLLTLQSAACTAGFGGVPLLAALLIVAASAKSAQGPLYFWLPSAMAGPTPISALIHAATMVAAGVYLLARTHGLLALSPDALYATAILGVATALFGAVMAIRQSNLKKGLAYSTVSQLGYMFAGIGFGAPFAAIFHLGSQAFFKALLFLTAGVVIHAVAGEEELEGMGRLARALPAATASFLIGSVSLFGLPLTAGAFSKDAILDGGFRSANDALAWCLVGGVFLSGLYIGRLFFATFYAAPRAEAGQTENVTEPAHEPVAAHEDLHPAEKEALLGPPGAGAEHEPPVALPDGRHIHRPSGLLTWPLLPLAIGALLFGYAQFPMGGLAQVLAPALGPAETLGLASGPGLLAALLGLAGFVVAGVWQLRRQAAIRPLPEGYGWVDWASGASVRFAGAFAGIQNGRAGRYVLATVLGFAAILLAGLKG